MHALELNHHIAPGGEVQGNLGGELDIATAERAVSYVSLVKIMRITGLDRRFLTFQIPQRAVSQAEFEPASGLK